MSEEASSVCTTRQGALGIQAKRSTQHLNHCLSYVSCCVFIFVSTTLRPVTCQTPFWSSPVGSEFKAIKLSMWKVPCTLPGNCALCIFMFCPGHFNEGGPCVHYISLVCPG
ncbi:hypothetical protein PAMP_021941 [Pampus punctatissimus]